MSYETKKLEELCPNKMSMPMFIMSKRGKELCGYCLKQCPDRFECNKYKDEAI